MNYFLYDIQTSLSCLKGRIRSVWARGACSPKRTLCIISSTIKRKCTDARFKANINCPLLFWFYGGVNILFLVWFCCCYDLKKKEGKEGFHVLPESALILHLERKEWQAQEFSIGQSDRAGKGAQVRNGVPFSSTLRGVLDNQSERQVQGPEDRERERGCYFFPTQFCSSIFLFFLLTLFKKFLSL